MTFFGKERSYLSTGWLFICFIVVRLLYQSFYWIQVLYDEAAWGRFCCVCTARDHRCFARGLSYLSMVIQICTIDSSCSKEFFNWAFELHMNDQSPFSHGSRYKRSGFYVGGVSKSTINTINRTRGVSLKAGTKTMAILHYSNLFNRWSISTLVSWEIPKIHVLGDRSIRLRKEESPSTGPSMDLKLRWEPNSKFPKFFEH